MNLSQLVRKARLEVDAIRANGVVSALWSDEEVIDAANTAMDRIARLVRLADSNILTKYMKSTDASEDMISEVYGPSALKMVSAQIDYTLPPDCVRIESITPLTSGYEGIRFYPAGIHQKGWIDQSTLTATDLSTVSGSEQIFYYVLIGARTLRIRPVLTETFDVEVAYQFRPTRLQNYSLGTVRLTKGSSIAHGMGGTAWLTSGVRAPADLVLDTAANVSVNAVYPRITSISTETEAALARTWASDSRDSSYHISMIPQLPEEHHSWLAQVTAATMLRKVSPELSKTALEELDKQLDLGVQPEVTIRQMQESLAVDEYTLP